jgi:hypothetical protein
MKNVDVFKGMLFEAQPMINHGYTVDTDLTTLRKPINIFYVTLSPTVATLFAVDPKNELLHDTRTSRALWNASSRGHDVDRWKTSWLEGWLSKIVEIQRIKMKNGDLGIIVRASLPIGSVFETYEHLLEQEVNLKSPVNITHIGVINNKIKKPVWLSMKGIPSDMFKSAYLLGNYILKKGKKIQWKSEKIPAFLQWAIFDINNYDSDSAFRIIVDSSDDVRKVLALFQKYEKEPKPKRYKSQSDGYY